MPPNDHNSQGLRWLGDADVRLGPEHLVVMGPPGLLRGLIMLQQQTMQRYRHGLNQWLLDGHVQPAYIWARPDAWLSYVDWAGPEIMRADD